MSKENFKSFARLHPELANVVLGGKTSWQKLYELFDIYGADSNVWDNYFQVKNVVSSTKPLRDATLGDIVRTIKNVDLDSVQKGITNLQKTIGLIEELGPMGSANDVKAPYEARPMYKYFED